MGHTYKLRQEGKCGCGECEYFSLTKNLGDYRVNVLEYSTSTEG